MKQSKIEYLAGLGGNDLLDEALNTHQCTHRDYCKGHKFSMKCNYLDTRKNWSCRGMDYDI
jgi:hypothetical protein